MIITKPILSNMLLKASEMLIAEADHLSEIDSRFGDGDHGVTIRKIAQATQTAVAHWQDGQGLKSFIDNLGTTVMGISGGSAGPLWGTMLAGLALPLEPDTTQIDPPMLAAMFTSALEEMESITLARVGDKTMMDVLIPAVEAAQKTARHAGSDTLIVLEKAADAAALGAQDTEKYVARFGRAKNYKEQTLGTPDAGAVSLMVFFLGLFAGAKEIYPILKVSQYR
jgi:phosphoenolpyruvate---glycerone phosphotransferase subunit DhaL